VGGFIMTHLKISIVLIVSLLAACTMQPEKSFEDELIGNWHIEMIKDKPVVDFSAASLRFNADGTLSGNASCNSLSSSYTVDGSNISLAEGAVTRKLCLGALMEQESRMLAALQDVRSARIENGMLYLKGDGGELIYKAAPSIK
jgi:heat shock protein HslJ|tara:strand:- start:11158 stop:11589 length:432 start_codon:yes stop_codon:yes gene_type:complete